MHLLQVVAQCGPRHGLPAVVAGQCDDAVVQHVHVQPLAECAVHPRDLERVAVAGRATSTIASAL